MEVLSAAGPLIRTCQHLAGLSREAPLADAEGAAVLAKLLQLPGVLRFVGHALVAPVPGLRPKAEQPDEIDEGLAAGLAEGKHAVEQVIVPPAAPIQRPGDLAPLLYGLRLLAAELGLVAAEAMWGAQRLPRGGTVETVVLRYSALTAK
jgi:hypothetical protein